ncbi:MAG: hypothetical protein ACFCVA_13130 [Gammaproteobacteria bacterium]|jgi:hypothetical protein
MLEPPWLETLVQQVANAIEAHSALGSLCYRYRHQDGVWEIVLYPTSIALRGGPDDGAIIVPGFSLDLKPLLDSFEEIIAVSWTTQPFGPDDSDNPSIAIEGRFQGQTTYLQILAEAPPDESPGLTLDMSSADASALH